MQESQLEKRDVNLLMKPSRLKDFELAILGVRLAGYVKFWKKVEGGKRQRLLYGTKVYGRLRICVYYLTYTPAHSVKFGPERNHQRGGYA